MILKALHLAILDLTVDDSFALVEVMARARQLLPNATRVDLKAGVNEALLELLDAGMIQLTRMETVETGEQALGPKEALQALDDDLAWIEPKHARAHIRVFASASGKAAYYATARH